MPKRAIIALLALWAVGGAYPKSHASQASLTASAVAAPDPEDTDAQVMVDGLKLIEKGPQDILLTWDAYIFNPRFPCRLDATYSVYRGATEDFNPAPSNRIAHHITTTTYRVHEPLPNHIYYYFVLVDFGPRCYRVGPPPPEQVCAPLEKEAVRNNPKAEYDLGQCYAVQRNDFTEAAEWFHKAAVQGFIVAQRRYANVLLYGYGITQSTPEALAWFQEAAERGDAQSAFMLGEVYADGGPVEAIKQPDGRYIGGPVPQSAAIAIDFVKAAYWYRVAADQGLPFAQNHLGDLYENGEGVPQDYKEAYFWLDIAEASGATSIINGVDSRDFAASHLTKAALLQVQERARRWLERRQAAASPQ